MLYFYAIKSLQTKKDVYKRQMVNSYYKFGPSTKAKYKIFDVSGTGSHYYINGMLDGSFAPADPVTYEQVVKMVVCSMCIRDRKKT